MVSADEHGPQKAPVTLNYHNHVAKHFRRYQNQPPPYWRPRVRGECENGPRPCPFVACRYNLFLDAKENGSILLNFGSDVGALEKMPDTCALDVADRGQHDGVAVGSFLNITGQAVRVATRAAVTKFKRYFYGNRKISNDSPH